MKKYNVHRKYDSLLHMMLYLEFLDLEDGWERINYKQRYFNQELGKEFARLIFNGNEEKNPVAFSGISSLLSNP